MRVGISLPFAGDPTGLVDAAGAAEAGELESVWVPDLVNVEGTPAHDPLVTLGVVAGATERVALGVGVLAVATRPLATLAPQLATLHAISGERLVLGLGAGGPPTASLWAAAARPDGKRGAQLETAGAQLAALLAGEDVDLYDGAGPARIDPPPSVPPLLVGGQRGASMRRAVSLGADWFPSLLTPAQLTEAREQLAAEAARQGRAVPAITAGVRVADPDDHDAIAQLERTIRDVYQWPGDPSELYARDDLAAYLDAYARAGADRVVVATVGGDWPAHCERIAATVRELA